MKTHFAITLFSVLFLIEHVQYKAVFVVVAFIATLLPDIDNGFSTLGKYNIFRPVQFFTRHRGLIHSFTFCVLVTLALALYWPILALPFFLGYALHLFVDSFTIDGIRPFWPSKKVSQGKIRVGGTIERVVLLVFGIIDAVLLFYLIFV